MEASRSCAGQVNGNVLVPEAGRADGAFLLTPAVKRDDHHAVACKRIRNVLPKSHRYQRASA